MSRPIHISRGHDRHAAALRAPRSLGPLPPVPSRIRDHVLELRSRVAFGIAVDRSHQSDVPIARVRYLRELERAANVLDAGNAAVLRASWATAYAAAVHDPRNDPRLGVCPRCDLAERVRLRPEELVPPGRLTHPSLGPPTVDGFTTEAAERLPRVRNGFALHVAQNAAHGEHTGIVRAIRVLTSTEQRLVRDHLDLTLQALPVWAALESSWAEDSSLLHEGCNSCWAIQRQRTTG